MSEYSGLVSVAEFLDSRYCRPEWEDKAPEMLQYGEDRFYQLTKRNQWGYWIQPKTRTVTLDGNGSRLLRTPYPLIDLHECVVYSEGAAGVVEDDVTDAIRFRSHFLHHHRGFPNGFANVVLTGDFGDPAFVEKDVPDDVKECIMRLAHMKLTRARIAGERVHERRPPGDEPVPPPTMTGDREVDGIIRSYTVRDMTVLVDFRAPLDIGDRRLEWRGAG